MPEEFFIMTLQPDLDERSAWRVRRPHTFTGLIDTYGLSAAGVYDAIRERAESQCSLEMQMGAGHAAIRNAAVLLYVREVNQQPEAE